MLSKKDPELPDTPHASLVNNHTSVHKGWSKPLEVGFAMLDVAAAGWVGCWWPTQPIMVGTKKDVSRWHKEKLLLSFELKKTIKSLPQAGEPKKRAFQEGPRAP